MGYYLAGFRIVGVDLKPQPRYPFEFHQADALTFPLDGFDAIHASPPCQAFTLLRNMGNARAPLDLLSPCRERLVEAGLPYVIENVVGAPMNNPIVLCGVMFKLKVFRHRQFETNIAMFSPPHVPHDGVIGDGRYVAVLDKQGGYPPRRKRPTLDRKDFSWEQEAMGIDWMTRYELTQAIPPAYTEYIGKHLMQYLVDKQVTRR